MASERTQPRILINGGGFDTPWIAELARLTGKPRPRLLYLPTAAGDRDDAINTWFERCSPLLVEARAQKMFIDSLTQTRSWEEVFQWADGIVCSGGNTLNQQAIWRAQGIDLLLRRAWKRGVVLGGASAGALCWFECGSTDSRPQALSIVQGLGLLSGSHCPHYDSESNRRPQYQQLIASGELPAGYACDEGAGLLFEGRRVARVLSIRPDTQRVYRVRPWRGGVREEALTAERLASAPA
ncbi:MAG: peptidase E [Burkholderiales bacterium]|nr:peptidase E [Burkholderiales bacterium]